MFLSDFSNIYFGDTRLKLVFYELMEAFFKGKTVIIKNLELFTDRIKAVYRFLKNKNVVTSNILEHHKIGTVARAKKMSENAEILVIQDTTYCNYNSKKAAKGVGVLGKNQYGDIKGFCIHNTICINDKQICAGILDQQTYNHGDFEHKQESKRWILSLEKTKKELPNAITVCDREGDFFDFFECAETINAKVIVRLTNNRYTKNQEGEKIIVKQLLKNKPLSFKYQNFKDNKTHNMTLCYANNVEFTPPKDSKNKNSVFFNVVYAKNEENPEIEWVLATNIAINSAENALKIVEYYGKRWHIEVFHNTIKNCFGIEEIYLRDFESIKKVVSMVSIAAMSLHSMTWMARSSEFSSLKCTTIVEQDVIDVVCLLLQQKTSKENPSIKDFVTNVAKIGGYLNRNSDGPPGIKTIYKGWTKVQNCLDFYKAIKLNENFNNCG
jgi:hypothetical protein